MSKIYRILLNAQWELKKLYEFPHAYYQAYAISYCFMPQMFLKNKEYLLKIFSNYQEDGKYTYVNIYTQFQTHVPTENRPIISSIHYASPGWLDLLLNPEIALQISKSVAIYLGVLFTAAKTYSKIYKILGEINKERKQQQSDDYKLTKNQLRELMELSNDIAMHVGFENVEAMDAHTKNPEITLKLLLAHYRRLKIIGNYITEGKVKLPHKMSNT